MIETVQRKKDQPASTPASELTKGTVLASSTFYNLLGQFAPLLVALFVIPILVQRMGVSRFGILALAWMLVGYFSLFDFGLGRALTKIVAEWHGRARLNDMGALIWTGLIVMLGAGLLGMVATCLISPLLTTRLLKIPLELQHEATGAFYVLAASIPIVIVTTGLRGVLEAHQRFDLVNALRIPLGVLGFLGPLVVVLFTNDLVAVVATLLLARIVVGVGHVWACSRVVPELHSRIAFRSNLLRPLLSFGGWMTVSSILSPAMVFADRFLIGAVISMAAVSYYATPFDMITKLLVVPMAIASVLFPAFATTYVSDRERMGMLFSKAVNYVFVLIYPFVFGAVALAPEGMRWWLGPEFAAQSSTVLRLLATGVLVNSLAQIPFAVVQGAGRPDLTAKLHLVEAPLFVAGLWFGVREWGITGAAAVWALRVFLDAVLLFVMAARLAPASAPRIARGAWVLAASLAALWAVTVIAPWEARSGVALAVVAALVWATWSVIFDERERWFVRNYREGLALLASRGARTAKVG